MTNLHPHLSQIARVISLIQQLDFRGELPGHIDGQSAIWVLSDFLAEKLEAKECASLGAGTVQGIIAGGENDSQ